MLHFSIIKDCALIWGANILPLFLPSVASLRLFHHSSKNITKTGGDLCVAPCNISHLRDCVGSTSIWAPCSTQQVVWIIQETTRHTDVSLWVLKKESEEDSYNSELNQNLPFSPYNLIGQPNLKIMWFNWKKNLANYPRFQKMPTTTVSALIIIDVIRSYFDVLDGDEGYQNSSEGVSAHLMSDCELDFHGSSRWLSGKGCLLEAHWPEFSPKNPQWKESTDSSTRPSDPAVCAMVCPCLHKHTYK